jgi:hypothetical protein
MREHFGSSSLWLFSEKSRIRQACLILLTSKSNVNDACNRSLPKNTIRDPFSSAIQEEIEMNDDEEVLKAKRVSEDIFNALR